MSERVACSKCGKWMFHLAVKCPHCGAERDPGAEKKLEVSSEEARALLTATSPPSELRFRNVAERLVLPVKDTKTELVLSVLAAPMTLFTLLVLGWGIMQTARNKRSALDLRGVGSLAVPVSYVFLGVILFQIEAPWPVWMVFSASLGAWFVRELLRSRKDPLD